MWKLFFFKRWKMMLGLMALNFVARRLFSANRNGSRAQRGGRGAMGGAGPLKASLKDFVNQPGQGGRIAG